MSRRGARLAASARRRLAGPLAALLVAGFPAPLTGTGPISHVLPAIGHHPVSRQLGRAAAGTTFSCQAPGSAFRCYGPSQIRAAYGVQPLLDAGITGAGRTIVIVDAFQDPTLQADLAAFDGAFGLPAPQIAAYAPDGLTPFNPANLDQVGWSAEIALDVEWSHALAPAASIALVLARSDLDADILSATRFAVLANLGDVISQSFGEGETCMTAANRQLQHAIFGVATLLRTTVLAASGDTGASEPGCSGGTPFLSVSTPASDPLVTAVGGTNLAADPVTGAYQAEVAWGDGTGLSGGGFSSVYPKPPFQSGVAAIGQFRGVPDVALNAGVQGGVIVAWGALIPGLFSVFGGTSAACPQWAGLVALLDQLAQRRVGFLNRALYTAGMGAGAAAAFHDITVGGNVVAGVGGYNAVAGWDPVTGWGTPAANVLLPQLAATA